MSRFDVALRRQTDARVKVALPSQSARMGRLVTVDPASAACTVIFDGSSIPAPVKRWRHVQARPGDRVGVQLYEREWVVVGAFSEPGVWIAAATTDSAAVLSETSMISITGFTFRAGMAYKLTLGGQLQGSVVNFSLWRVRDRVAGPWPVDWGQFGHYSVPSANTATALLGEHFLKRTAADDLTDQTISVSVNASSGTVTHVGTTQTPRYLMIEEWGPAATCPQGLAV